MQRTHVKYLFISIGLHILLLLSLNLLTIFQRIDTHKPLRSLVNIEFIEQPQATSMSHQPKLTKNDYKPKNRKSTQVANKLKNIPLHSLVPKLRLDPSFQKSLLKNISQQITATESTMTTTQDPSDLSAANSYMRSIGLSQSILTTTFFEALWTRINNDLVYPKDFYNQRIQGDVYAEVIVNEKGSFIDFAKISSKDDILSVFISVVILHALKEPLPQRNWLKESQTFPIALSFHFETYSFHEQKQKETIPVHSKNSLLFSRSAYIKPKAVENIETFYTKYFPPIIPIPGGVYIDFGLAYKMIKGWGQPTDSEKRKYRLEQYKELLKHALKKELTSTDPA